MNLLNLAVVYLVVILTGASALEIAQMTGLCTLIELGSGSSRKTRLLLDAYSQFQQELQYFPIDVSAGILQTTALDLLHQYPKLKLCGLAGTYEQALAQLPPAEFENRKAEKYFCPKFLSPSWV